MKSYFLILFSLLLASCPSLDHNIKVEPQIKKEDVVVDPFYVIHGDELQIRIFSPSKGYSIRDLEMIGAFLELDITIEELAKDEALVAMTLNEWLTKVEPLLIEAGIIAPQTGGGSEPIILMRNDIY